MMSYSNTKYITKKLYKLKVVMVFQSNPNENGKLDSFIIKFQNEHYLVEGVFLIDGIEDAYKILNKQANYSLNIHSFSEIKKRFENLNGVWIATQVEEKMNRQMDAINKCEEIIILKNCYQMKARKTIAGRRKMSKLLQLMNTRFGTCECCGTPWSHVKGHALAYKQGSSFFPICVLCYHDEKISFADLLIYYKREDEYPHTAEQYEFIKNSLMEEVKTDEIIKTKYEKYLSEVRENKIDSIL